MNLYEILRKKDSLDEIHSQEIKNDVLFVFNKYKDELQLMDLLLDNADINHITDQIILDLVARVDTDPTSVNQSIVYYHSKSFLAIFLYRIVNYIINKYKDLMSAEVFAYHISEYASASTGIEIHYRTHIGHSFVLDHGYNTVIGETAIIGNNCTLLNNITIGATKIAFNPQKGRHPIIGDNAQIAAGVNILGRITIGNNVKIGPYCVIKEDIPDDVTVKLIKEQMQIRKRIQ